MAQVRSRGRRGLGSDQRTRLSRSAFDTHGICEPVQIRNVEDATRPDGELPFAQLLQRLVGVNDGKSQCIREILLAERKGNELFMHETELLRTFCEPQQGPAYRFQSAALTDGQQA